MIKKNDKKMIIPILCTGNDQKILNFHVFFIRVSEKVIKLVEN